jgi:catechol 2,3-dioxygenase-like lactoylglutathione lyase family enzyme
MRQNLRRPLVTATLRGVHHLALCTDDMKATIDFYADVLGMPLVHAMKVPPGLGTGPGNRGNPPYERVRHYFFDMGNDSLLAFFEIPKGVDGHQGARADAIASAGGGDASRPVARRLDQGLPGHVGTSQFGR